MFFFSNSKIICMSKTLYNEFCGHVTLKVLSINSLCRNVARNTISLHVTSISQHILHYYYHCYYYYEAKLLV